MELLIKMVQHNLWLLEQMLTRAATLDDEHLDAPIEIPVDGIAEDPSLRSLLSRLVGQLDMWTAATAGRPYDFSVEQDETVAHMRDRLADAGPAFLSVVCEAREDGRLDETFVDAVCDPPEVFSYGGMIAHVLTFAAHRRMLVMGALHNAGIADLGSGDPMRWLADHV